MHDVFLSYSRKDTIVMRKIRDALRIANITVWTDENLEVGTPAWQMAIQEAVDSAKVMVVLLSPDAKKSQWVNRELAYATKRSVRILPIVVRGPDSDAIPIQLIDYQYLDLQGNSAEGIQNLISIIKKRAGPQPRALRDVDQLREEFWTQLIKKASNTRFSNIKPGRYSYIQVGAGKSGVVFRYVVYNNSAEIDLYIDNDKDSGEGNKLILAALEANSGEIQREFGGELDWRVLDENRASRIVISFEGRGLQTPDEWEALQTEMIQTMTRFDNALRKQIQRIEI